MFFTLADTLQKDDNATACIAGQDTGRNPQTDARPSG